MFPKIGVFLPCLALVLSACSGAGSSAGTETQKTVLLESGDGAQAQVPVDENSGSASGTLTKESEAQGKVVDDAKDVSAVYSLTIDGVWEGTIAVAIPLAKDLLSTNANAATLMPEYEVDGVWRAAGGARYYDEAAGVLVFAANRLTVEEAVDTPADASTSSALATVRSALKQQKGTGRFRVSEKLFSSAVVSEKDGSKFRIHYYPSSLKTADSIPGDDAWDPVGSHTWVDADVPDFIEDLHLAADQAYASLLEIEGPSGRLFSPLSGSAFDIYVSAIAGGSAGDSPLGGPLTLSNDQLKSLADMRAVAAHELVHVFQGQYYARGTAGNVFYGMLWTKEYWFIEAVANHYAARTVKPDLEGRRNLYGANEQAAYPSLGIGSSHRESYYMAAHFLDFLAAQCGPGVIAATIAGSRSESAFAHLSRAIGAARKDETLLTLFSRYVWSLVGHPETDGNWNAAILNKTDTYSITQGYWTPAGAVVQLRDDTPFARLQRPLAPLALAATRMYAKNDREGLLVLDTGTGTGSAIETLTFDTLDQTEATFKDRLPLEDGTRKPLTVEGCGKGKTCAGFTYVAWNSTTVGSAKLDFSCYFLFAPQVTAVEKGRVRWSTAAQGNIPQDYIAGYDVYRQDASGSYAKLGTKTWAGESELSLDVAVEADDPVLVQVRDWKGHVWPKIETSAGEDVWIGCRSFVDGVYRWGCVRFANAPKDPESEAFTSNAGLACTKAGYKQYYAVSFDKEDACKDWCSESAGDGGACDTPGSGTVDPGKGPCKGVAAGSDVCFENACYNCCDGCDAGYVWLYDCSSGCYTSGQFCECN